MARKRNPVLDQAFSEVFNNPPKAVVAEARKKGAKKARKMSIAIAFSKARRAGAKV